VRWENEGFFGCDAFARALGQPNVPECVVAIDFSSGFLRLCTTAGGVPSGGERRQRIYPPLRIMLRAQLPRMSRNPPHWVHPLLQAGF